MQAFQKQFAKLCMYVGMWSNVHHNITFCCQKQQRRVSSLVQLVKRSISTWLERTDDPDCFRLAFLSSATLLDPGPSQGAWIFREGSRSAIKEFNNKEDRQWFQEQSFFSLLKILLAPFLPLLLLPTDYAGRLWSDVQSGTSHAQLSSSIIRLDYIVFT